RRRSPRRDEAATDEQPIESSLNEAEENNQPSTAPVAVRTSAIHTSENSAPKSITAQYIAKSAASEHDLAAIESNLLAAISKTNNTQQAAATDTTAGNLITTPHEKPEKTITTTNEEIVAIAIPEAMGVQKTKNSPQPSSTRQLPLIEVIDEPIAPGARASNDPRLAPKPLATIQIVTETLISKQSSALDTSLPPEVAHNPRPISRPANDPRMAKQQQAPEANE
ncbi:MAG: hypothetical protein V4660_19740, partial [Pseudomonadota bacterium]